MNDVYTIGMPFFGDSCGEIAFPESGLEGNFLYQSRLECFEYIKGPAPTSGCYMFKSTRQDLRPFPEPWDEDSNRFMTFSVQQDGGVFLAHVHGTAAKASGLLSPFF
jgi:hypothetical protein